MPTAINMPARSKKPTGKRKGPRKARMGARKVAKERGFRLAAKQLFLTYPICPLKAETVLSQLQDIVPVVDYIVAEEKHADGQPHVHVYLKCDKKIDTTNARLFDLTCPDDGTIYHGNYQGCTSGFRVQRYCKKGTTYITNMVFNLLRGAIKLAEDGDVTGALQAVCEARPDMILQGRDRVMTSLQGIAGAAAEDKGETCVILTQG